MFGINLLIIVLISLPIALIVYVGAFIYQEISVYKHKDITKIYSEAQRLHREYPGEVYLVLAIFYGFVVMILTAINVLVSLVLL